MKGSIENFAIIVRVNGGTKQVLLTKSQKQLFAKLTLGALSEEGKLNCAPIDDMISLPPDPEAFSSSED